jgi:excisionase family DNA binding protein
MGSDERWVGVEKVATHLGVAKDSVYRWVESRDLPAHRVGRLLRFKLSEVDAWVEAGGGEGEAQVHASRTVRARLRKETRSR